MSESFHTPVSARKVRFFISASSSASAESASAHGVGAGSVRRVLRRTRYPAAAPKAAPAAPKAAPAKAAAPVAAGTKVNAPMPGTILDVKVSQGQAVKKGDILLILEAMKMENEILAPQDGSVAQVNVRS